MEKIGEIGVDAGLCWIGDPCYILHCEKNPEAIGKDWGEFCRNLQDPKTMCSDGPSWQFNYDHGHAGLGVCVSSGHGDGTYPVYAEIENGIVKSIKVVFVDDEEDDYETCECCGDEVDPGCDLCDECQETEDDLYN